MFCVSLYVLLYSTALYYYISIVNIDKKAKTCYNESIFFRHRRYYMKKLICTILLASMFFTAAACAEKSGNNAVMTTAANEQTESETAEIILEPNLPDIKFDGYAFKILISSNNETGGVKNDFAAPEQNGDTINDARFARNLAIEEKYDIDIVDHPVSVGHNGVGLSTLKKSVTAADYAYDAAMMAGYDTCALAYTNFLMDLYSIEHLDLTQPWWDQKANEDLTILGKMYYTTGDISTADNDATYAILFNKKLVTDYGLGDYYQLVKDGKWTIDSFCESVTKVHSDLDGNGQYDTNDLYGALLWDDTMMGIVNASGGKCCTVNKEGLIELTLNTDRVVEMISKYFSVALNKEICHTYQRKNWDGIAANNMFSSNQALFFLRLLIDVSFMRNMDADFGILPYPKLDEAQDSYYHTVGSWHSVFMCVPIVQEDPERTGIILEALAAKSMYTLTPAYYDISLKSKYTRDTESTEMLDIILETRTYDLGWYYEIGTYNEQVMNMLRNFKDEFTSMYAKYEKTALKKIDTINTAFSEIAG
jgi:hypothetical protein